MHGVSVEYAHPLPLLITDVSFSFRPRYALAACINLQTVSHLLPLLALSSTSWKGLAVYGLIVQEFIQESTYSGITIDQVHS